MSLMRACHGLKRNKRKVRNREAGRRVKMLAEEKDREKEKGEGKNEKDRFLLFCFRPFYSSPAPTLANTPRPLGNRSGKKFGPKLVT